MDLSVLVEDPGIEEKLTSALDVVTLLQEFPAGSSVPV